MDENENGSNMGRNIIIAILVVLVIAGISSYVAYQQNEDFKKAVTALVAMDDEPTTTANVAFAPATTEGVPFVATVTTTDGGESVTGVMTSDGLGNVNYAYQAAGQDASLTYTPDAYYLCGDGTQCIKYANTEATSQFDPEAYQFDGTKIEELKTTAAYKGQEACPAPATGTCDVWSVTSEAGVTTTMYVNTETKRIARVTTASGTTSSEVTYDYKNATVTIPTNYVEAE